MENNEHNNEQASQETDTTLVVVEDDISDDAPPQIIDDEDQEIEFIPLEPYDENEFNDLPPLVPITPNTFFINGNAHMNPALVNWAQQLIQLPDDVLGALLVTHNAALTNNLHYTYYFTQDHNQFVMEGIERLVLALERCKNDENFLELEVLKGTKDCILQIDDFENDDIAYVLDDCLTNFYLFETLEQIFSVQRSTLNPFNQTPIQRIIKVKLKVV